MVLRPLASCASRMHGLSECKAEAGDGSTTMIIIQQIMSTKAAELLRALNSQIIHEPPPVLPVISEEPATALPREQSSGLTSVLLEPKVPQPAFNTKMRYEEGSEAPECLTEILMKLMAANEKLFESVQSLLRQREKNAYDSFIGATKEYVQVMLDQASRQQNPYLEVVASMIAKRQTKVEADLSHGSLHLHPERNLSNRRQIDLLEKLDLARMIKIKDGELRSKIDVLHSKLEDFEQLSAVEAAPSAEEEELQRRVIENIDAHTYSLQSERTKIAQEYVKHLQHQRRSFEVRRKERQARYQQEQAEREADLRQAEQMRDLAKHQEILQRIDQSRKRREEEEKQFQAKEQEAKKILALHHRKLPIFKIKEKEFEEKILRPAQRYREEKLSEIRASRRAMSLQEMRQHEEKYLSKLQASQAKREEQFKLILKSRQPGVRRRYYKGSAHSRIEKMTKEDILRSLSLREASKMKLHRMKEYNQVVHKLHAPAINCEKRRELEKSMQDDLMRKKHAKKVFRQVQDPITKEIRFQSYYEELPSKDPKLEGNRFFEEAKKHAKKKDKETAIARIEQLEKDKQEREPKQKVKLLGDSEEKKERNLWDIRGKQLKEIANSEVQDASQFEFVKHNIKNLDSKAAEREELMRHVEAPLQEQMKEKGKLEEFYLESIKQKMKLLE